MDKSPSWTEESASQSSPNLQEEEARQTRQASHRRPNQAKTCQQLWAKAITKELPTRAMEKVCPYQRWKRVSRSIHLSNAAIASIKAQPPSKTPAMEATTKPRTMTKGTARSVRAAIKTTPPMAMLNKANAAKVGGSPLGRMRVNEVTTGE
jgi:hypothetical protein